MTVNNPENVISVVEHPLAAASAFTRSDGVIDSVTVPVLNPGPMATWRA